MTLASRRKDLDWEHTIKGDKNPNFKGGRYIDDKGYIRVLKPDHPFNNAGYVYEHRLVMEKELRRFLQPWETVHHINEIKLDNRLENFFLTTVPEHGSIHREGKKQSKERRQNMSNKTKARMQGSKRTNGKFTKSSPTEGQAATLEGS